ncbi:MAG: heptosyltransferase-2 [Planctomycetota bacterium]|jgi:heptosyltransferase-2
MGLRDPFFLPQALTEILIIKTGALGDVLRTTSILPGLHERFPDARVTWITAPSARDLVVRHRLVAETIDLNVKDAGACVLLQLELAQRAWSWVISLDDELSLCSLAHAMRTERLSGATLGDSGERSYTGDVAAWFDMGLLSKHGKQTADRLKVQNKRSHPEIYAAMLGISMGKPELPIPQQTLDFGLRFAQQAKLNSRRNVIGLNTGAGGRWHSKGLPIEVVVRFVELLNTSLGGDVDFLLLGGPEEDSRNRDMLARVMQITPTPNMIDSGTDNSLPDFAAIVSQCDLLLTSDSLALHVAIAREVRIVSFFAPTSAAEIHLYGQGVRLRSTAPDYCSYRPDADNSSLTAERLCAAVIQVLAGDYERDGAIDGGS